MTSANKPQPQQGLQCMEVWGGSSIADHSASVPGLDISVSSRPVDGADAGGDLYLISSCSSGWITRMLLADVSGHGSDVSEFSKQLRKSMHKSINTVDQTKLAHTLNNAFDTISNGKKFATALFMTYFAPSGHLIFVNAGHPPPMLQRAGTDVWVPVDQSTPGVLKSTTKDVRVGIKNLPLGVIASTNYEQLAIPFSKGDRFCAYTDAFTEAQASSGSMLGVQGLADVLTNTDSIKESRTSAETAQNLLSELTSLGYEHAEDDHTMLMLHHNGQKQSAIGIKAFTNMIKDSIGLGHIDTVV
ncbi:MAG: PP2C family protein-serine/threonine phosphatase [Phycisphaerales bacterium]